VTGKSCLKSENGRLLDVETTGDVRSSTHGNDGEEEEVEKAADGVSA
jgi:hypothetical protein